MATYFEGQVLKLGGAHYIVMSLAESGYPYAIYNCDEFGNRLFPNADPILASSKVNGFKHIDWYDVTPTKESLANQKYIDVIRKIRAMDKRFAERKLYET